MPGGLDRHPRFQRLADYLASKAPDGRLPGRQHIDPLDIPDLLPHLMLIDVVRQQSGWRYRVRLVGTEVVQIHGADQTGQFVEDFLSTEGEGEEIRRGYDEAVRTRAPQYRSGTVVTNNRQHVAFERVAFPLARDGELVDMLIFVFAQRLK